MEEGGDLAFAVSFVLIGAGGGASIASKAWNRGTGSVF